MRISDWSSDVCSSDLRAGNLGWAAGEEQTVARGRSHGADVGIDANVGPLVEPARRRGLETAGKVATVITDRKSVVEGKSVSRRVDLGGGRNIKTTKKRRNNMKEQMT